VNYTPPHTHTHTHYVLKRQVVKSALTVRRHAVLPMVKQSINCTGRRTVPAQLGERATTFQTRTMLGVVTRSLSTKYDDAVKSIDTSEDP